MYRKGVRMTLDERLIRFNNLFVAMQVEIAYLPDKSKNEKLIQQLMAMQVEFIDLYHAITDKQNEKENRSSYSNERDIKLLTSNKAPSGEKKNVPIEEQLRRLKEMLVTLDIRGGSPRLRDDGRYEFRHPVWGSIYGKTPEEIYDKMVKILEDLEQQKKPVKPKKKLTPLLSDVYKNHFLPYRQSQAKKLSASTVSAYDSDIRFIQSKGFDKPIGDYTSKEIKDFLLATPEPRKRQILQGHFNAIFAYAVTEMIIKHDPCLAIATMQHIQDEGTAFSFVEQIQFFTRLFEDDTIPYSLKCYYIFVYLTGSRRNEALDVLYQETDFENQTLKINGTKTNGSDRYFPFSTLIEKLLRSLTPNEDGKFFPHCDSIVDRVFKHKLMKPLNLDHVIHDLRHTFGTIQICVEKVELKTVCLWMGHSNIETTLKTYTHPEQLDRATFLRGNLTDKQKIEIYKKKYEEVLHLIDTFISAHTER
jgi:integrase